KRQQTDRQQALLAQLQAAYASGAVPAMRVDAVARVLGDATLGQTDEKTAQAMLEKIAPVYPASWVSLAQLLYDFPELGDVDKMMEYLDKGRNADQPRAELLLGKVYYEGKLVIPDAKKAEQHLKAAAPTQISAHYYLGQIYRRGYLGEPEPQKAVDNLLMAARGGQASADFALAQLYSGGRGTQPNPVYAYMFVQLAKAQPDPAQPVLDLATQLETTMTPDQRTQAQQLLQQEQHVRGAMNQNSSIALQTLEDEDGEDKSL
ncbi:MAG: alginate biosynthesis protein AlgK, partial [Pseudomonas sp.]